VENWLGSDGDNGATGGTLGAGEVTIDCGVVVDVLGAAGAVLPSDPRLLGAALVAPEDARCARTSGVEQVIKSSEKRMPEDLELNFDFVICLSP
jgi:hypothetical protein